jgi:hypothetical protein
MSKVAQTHPAENAKMPTARDGTEESRDRVSSELRGILKFILESTGFSSQA